MAAQDLSQKNPWDMEPEEISKIAKPEADVSTMMPWEMSEDQISKSAKSPERGFLSRLGYNTLSALPTVGAIGGGMLGGSVAGPVGAAGGAGAGAVAGKSLEQSGKKLFYDEGPETRKEQYSELAKAAPEGMMQEMTGQSIGKLASVPGAMGGIRDINPSQEIEAAAKALGTNATPGMKSQNQTIKNIESSLEQSPSIAGSIVRKGTNDVRQALQNAGKNVFDGIERVQPSDVGGQVKADLSKKIQDKLDTIGSYYDDVRKSSEFMDVPERSKNAVARNIENVSKLKSSPATGWVQNVADDLRNVESADDIKALRSNVGKTLSNPNASPQEKAAAATIYGKLANLEQNTYMRSAIQVAKQNRGGTIGITGEKLGQELIDDLKSANKQYGGLINDLKDIGQGSGLAKNLKYPQQFLNKLDQVPDEEIVNKLFRPNNRAYLEKLQSTYPEQFESLKRARLDSIRKDIEMPNGNLDINKLIKNVQAFEPSTQELLFGKSGKDLVDKIKTVASSIPSKVGASGTPQGMEFLDLLSPSWALSQVPKAAQLGLLKASEYAPNMGLIGKALQNSSVNTAAKTAGGIGYQYLKRQDQ